MSTATTAAKPVDLVIVIDTSGSMADEAAALSAALNAAVEEAKKACPSDLRVQFLGIEGTFSGTAFDNTVRNYLTGKGVDAARLKGRVRDSVANAGAQEDVARAVEDISQWFDWRTGAERNVFVLGDESLEGGEMTLDAARIQACDSAIASALSREVKVHTYLGTPHASTPYPTPQDEAAMVKEYKRLALRTGGEHYIYTRGVADFAVVLKQTICASKVPHEESVADKKEEADRLEGINSNNGGKPGSNICDHAGEIVRAVNTLADVLKTLVEVCGLGGGKAQGCRCHEHDSVENKPGAGGAQPEPCPPFSDITTFEGDNWNGWQAGPAGKGLYLVDAGDGKRAVEFITGGKANDHAGLVLTKTLDGLKAGCEYTFSLRAVRIIGKSAAPKISLLVDASEVVTPLELSKADEWVTLSGTFIAKSNKVELAVESHVATGMGNDYRITDIKIGR